MGQKLMTDNQCYRTNAELYFTAHICANAVCTQMFCTW